jgi:anthranilate synthase component 1
MIPVFNTQKTSIQGDTLTPVAAYQRIRNRFPYSLLLECSDYQARDNSYSFICFEPIAGIEFTGETLRLSYAGNLIQERKPNNASELSESLELMISRLAPETDTTERGQGLYGYFAYSTSGQLEQTRVESGKAVDETLPDFSFHLYKYVLVFNHLTDELDLLEQLEKGEVSKSKVLLDDLLYARFSAFPFRLSGDEKSDLTDRDFKDLVKKGKRHCQRGDVFQVVFSRQFRTHYTGDEFAVYRSLRSINPSPYLFFLDTGAYRLFGSSPETQLQIQNGRAILHPIAGTYKRTGEDLADLEAAKQLLFDPKEKAEHTMLVDLARNDLSRQCTDVTVDTWCETQFFSHVIHLVSKVSGAVKSKQDAIKLLFSTFPAGTLTGAPKIRAMQLIDENEPLRRSFYGGAIGQIGFDGSCNLAILIRSFLATKNVLHYQAGAGIVAASSEENELQEVNNKLAALRKAMLQAEKRNSNSKPTV